MKRRKSYKVGVNPPLIMDVAGAMLIVDKLPMIVEKFVGIPTPFVKALVGTGAGYLTGMF